MKQYQPLPALWCRPFVSEKNPAKQGLKQGRLCSAARLAFVSEKNPAKQGLKHSVRQAPSQPEKVSEKNPAKQGLKPCGLSALRPVPFVSEKNPAKQGLKRRLSAVFDFGRISLREESSKTRIETELVCFSSVVRMTVSEKNPAKQGLKLAMTSQLGTLCVLSQRRIQQNKD